MTQLRRFENDICDWLCLLNYETVTISICILSVQETTNSLIILLDKKIVSSH